jgi:mycothiol synthase
MDESAYRTRPFVDADYAIDARLDEQWEPGFNNTAEEIRDWETADSREPGRLLYRLVVEDRASGEGVAVGRLAHTSWNYHPTKYQLMVLVDQTHRRRGIGGYLFARLEHEAVGRGATHLWTSIREDDPAGTRFFAAHGFRRQRRTWRSVLDVSDPRVDAFADRGPALEARGIHIASLSDEGVGDPVVLHRLYDLGMSSGADVPRQGEYHKVSYDTWLAMDIQNVRAMPEASFLARSGDRYVGVTLVERELGRPETAHVGYTGTDREFRGLGIATELKRRAALYLRVHGIRYLSTGNDSENVPIWAINEKMGFQRKIAWVHGEKSLGEP